MADEQIESDKPPRYSLEQQEDVATNLDPKLQKAILQSRSGQDIDPTLAHTSLAGEVLIDVLARVRNPTVDVPGLKTVRVIGDIVTGTVNINDLEGVRGDPNVISLKGARKVRPELRFSVPEIRATQQQLTDVLPGTLGAVNGEGVIVGVVDYGCDFVHNNFRNADGSTRILFLWDQGSGGATSLSPDGFPYGREFNAEGINEALRQADPYQHLAYLPGSSAHGTHVLDIAAGNGRATGVAGVAPKADIIFVHVSANDLAGEGSFGNSRNLLEAVDYIFTKANALGKSAVVNISLGTNGGPHDGSTPVEKGLDHFVELPGRAVVVAASNSWADRIHTSGNIAPGQEIRFGWNIPLGSITPRELEIWYSGSDILEATLIDPSGEVVGTFKVGTTTAIKVEGQDAGVVFHRQKDPNNGDNQIDIILGPRLMSGIWEVALTAEGSAVDFHAWVERDDSSQSSLSDSDANSSCTIGSISCGKKTLVVGSYDATVPGRDISAFSSEGPTRDLRQKPELSAPGHGIMAAKSFSQTSTAKWGTSMAAPHVAGLVALLMHAAGHPLTIEQIRETLIGIARLSPPSGPGWNPRYGQGRIDAAAAILTQLLLEDASNSASAPGDGEPVPPNGPTTTLNEGVSTTA